MPFIVGSRVFLKGPRILDILVKPGFPGWSLVLIVVLVVIGGAFLEFFSIDVFVVLIIDIAWTFIFIQVVSITSRVFSSSGIGARFYIFFVFWLVPGIRITLIFIGSLIFSSSHLLSVSFGLDSGFARNLLVGWGCLLVWLFGSAFLEFSQVLFHIGYIESLRWFRLALNFFCDLSHISFPILWHESHDVVSSQLFICLSWPFTLPQTSWLILIMMILSIASQIRSILRFIPAGILVVAGGWNFLGCAWSLNIVLFSDVLFNIVNLVVFGNHRFWYSTHSLSLVSWMRFISGIWIFEPPFLRSLSVHVLVVGSHWSNILQSRLSSGKILGSRICYLRNSLLVRWIANISLWFLILLDSFNPWFFLFLILIPVEILFLTFIISVFNSMLTVPVWPNIVFWTSSLPILVFFILLGLDQFPFLFKFLSFPI